MQHFHLEKLTVQFRKERVFLFLQKGTSFARVTLFYCHWSSSSLCFFSILSKCKKWHFVPSCLCVCVCLSFNCRCYCCKWIGDKERKVKWGGIQFLVCNLQIDLHTVLVSVFCLHFFLSPRQMLPLFTWERESSVSMMTSIRDVSSHEYFEMYTLDTW